MTPDRPHQDTTAAPAPAEPTPASAETHTGDAAIALTDVAVRRGARLVLSGVSLLVPRGARCHVLGPVGCGKTTLLLAIAGLCARASGAVRVLGAEVPIAGDGFGVRDAAGRPQLGYLPQDDGLWEHVRAQRTLELALWFLPRGERRCEARRWLDRVGLTEHARAHAGALSGGQRRRLALARALAPGPALLLLDEPFASLDVLAARALAALVTTHARATGATVIAVSHAPPLAEGEAGERPWLAPDDLALRLDHGRPRGLGSVAALAADKGDAFAQAFFHRAATTA